MRRRYFNKKASSTILSPVVGGVADMYYGNVDKDRLSEFVANRAKEALGGFATDTAVSASLVPPVVTGAFTGLSSAVRRKMPGKGSAALMAASLLPLIGTGTYAAYRPLQMIKDAKARRKKSMVDLVREKLGLQ